MRYGQPLMVGKFPKTLEYLSKSFDTRIRHISGKKFLLPDSFKSHLKDKSVQQKSKEARKSERPRSLPTKNITHLRQHVDGTPLTASNSEKPRISNAVQIEVANAAPKVLGLATQPMLEAFCGRSNHLELASFINAHSNIIHFDIEALRNFWALMRDILPEDVLNKSYITSPRGKISHLSYSWSLQESTTGHFDRRNVCNLGWHLFLTTTPISPTPGRLLYDGTNTRFLPGPPATWKYRLWAGGSIDLYKVYGADLTNQDSRYVVERPVDFRIVGAGQSPEKVFVTVSKQFFDTDLLHQGTNITSRTILDRLSGEPKFSRSGAQIAGPFLEEKYTLCFLRNPPVLSGKGSATRVIAPPTQPKFSHTLTPNRHLLFGWSALSYNAHLIHLDPSFAQEEYGAKDLVVHGPLTLVLMLEWFTRTITKYAIDRQLNKFHLRSIEYKNLIPLFVDEPMTLCTKPTKFPTPGTLAESWEVWVEKDLGDGLKTMAFKGTIKIRVEDEPTKPESIQQGRGWTPIDRGYARDRVEKRSDNGDDRDAEDFRSPFFRASES